MSQDAADDHADSNGPTFDLVLATTGRTVEVAHFLRSLGHQTYKRFRVILVDQNGDDRLKPIVADHSDALAIAEVVSHPGLSRARNVAFDHVTCEIVAFPDDDCVYPRDLLERVGDLLRRHPEWDGLAGRTVDQSDRSSFLLWSKEPTFVTRTNVWRTAVATTMFLRRYVVERVGQFDESLGAGSGTQWGSGEETDYLLRALTAGFTIRYEPAICVVHESPRPESPAASTHKAYVTGMGNSRVLRKHRYSAWFAAYRVLQLVGGSVYFLFRGRVSLARFYAAMARGRIRGWLEG